MGAANKVAGSTVVVRPPAEPAPPKAAKVGTGVLGGTGGPIAVDHLQPWVRDGELIAIDPGTGVDLRLKENVGDLLHESKHPGHVGEAAREALRTWARAMGDSELEGMGPMGKHLARQLVMAIREDRFEAAQAIADGNPKLKTLWIAASVAINHYNHLSGAERAQVTAPRSTAAAATPSSRPATAAPQRGPMVTDPKFRSIPQPAGDFRWDYGRPVIGADGRQVVKNGVPQFEREMIEARHLTVRFVYNKSGELLHKDVFDGDHYIGTPEQRKDLLANNDESVTYVRTAWEDQHARQPVTGADHKPVVKDGIIQFERNKAYQPLRDPETRDVLGYTRSEGQIVTVYDLKGREIGSCEKGLEHSLIDPIDFAGPEIVLGLGKVALAGGKLVISEALKLALRQGAKQVAKEGAEISGRILARDGAAAILSRRAATEADTAAADGAARVAASAQDGALFSMGGPIRSPEAVFDVHRRIEEAFLDQWKTFELKAAEAKAGKLAATEWGTQSEAMIVAATRDVQNVRLAANKLLARGDAKAAARLEEAARAGEEALGRMKGLAAHPN
jgi:hypothetical protein